MHHHGLRIALPLLCHVRVGSVYQELHAWHARRVAFAKDNGHVGLLMANGLLGLDRRMHHAHQREIA